jgi:hypothetical protein
VRPGSTSHLTLGVKTSKHAAGGAPSSQSLGLTDSLSARVRESREPKIFKLLPRVFCVCFLRILVLRPSSSSRARLGTGWWRREKDFRSEFERSRVFFPQRPVAGRLDGAATESNGERRLARASGGFFVLLESTKLNSFILL